MVGVLIVAVSVLVGARVLATSDDMSTVWALRADLPAGSAITEADLEPQGVRFSSERQAGAYVSAGDTIPADATLARDLATGELLPRSALTGSVTDELVEVPLAVPSDAVVASLQVGETVDVWVTPPAAQGGAPEAERVLSGVRVVAVPDSATALGPATTRQVVVGVPVTEEDELGGALARLASGTVVVVRRS